MTWHDLTFEVCVIIPHFLLTNKLIQKHEDTHEKAFQRLRSIFDGTEILEKSSSVFAHISDVITYLKRLNVHCKVYLSPLASFNDKFYKGGLLFQCLYDQKRKDVFAAGGRYDSLIREHRRRIPQGQQNALCHAVGFNLAWEKLAYSMSKFQKASAKNFLKKPEDELQGPWLTRRVCSYLASCPVIALIFLV